MVALVVEHPGAAEQYAYGEEADGLREAAVRYRPLEVADEAVGDSGSGDIEETALGAGLEHGHVVFSAAAERERRRLGVDEGAYYAHYLDRLDEHHRGNRDEHGVAGADERDDEERADGVDSQDVAVVEAEVKQTPCEEQQHAPEETRPEVDAFLRLVVVLDEEAQSEEQGEDRVHLASEDEEGGVPYGLVEPGRFGKRIEIEVFDEMQQDYAGYCYAPEDVGDIDTGVREARGRVNVFHGL